MPHCYSYYRLSDGGRLSLMSRAIKDYIHYLMVLCELETDLHVSASETEWKAEEE